MSAITEDFSEETFSWFSWTRRVINPANGDTLFSITCRMPRRDMVKLLPLGKQIEIPDIERTKVFIFDGLRFQARKKGLEILDNGDPIRFSKEHVVEVTADELNL